MSAPQPYNYVISVDSQGTYYAISTSTGNPIPNGVGSDPGPVIQAALDQPPITEGGPGDIYIRAGPYILRGGFTGFNLQGRIRLILDQNAIIIVPNGYAGYVFKLYNDQPGRIIGNCVIDGGCILEAGSQPLRNWTALVLESKIYRQGGVLYNKFVNMTIYDAGIGVQLVADNPPATPPDPMDVDGGWVNANSFQCLKMIRNKIFIDFVMRGNYVEGSERTGIFGNHFEDLHCVCGQNTTDGIRHIEHKYNFFSNVRIENLPPGSRIADIVSVAKSNSIIAGEMTSSDPNVFLLPQPDNTNTLIFDNYHGPGGQQILEDIKNELPPLSPGISTAPSELRFGDVPVQYFVGLRITITNTKPCANIDVTLTTSGPPFYVTEAEPTSLPPNSTMVSGKTSDRFVVVFAPTLISPTPITGTLTINTNDPLIPSLTVPLSGRGVQANPVALELILDRSGSMSGPAPGGTKMDALKTAVNLFADLLTSGQGDEMGSVEFDDMVNVLTLFGIYDNVKKVSIKADANGLTPRNLTSIGGGIQLGQSQFAGSTIQRKVMLIFTDGMENTPPTIASVTPSVIAANIEMYSIGLGQPQYISSEALSALAVASNGRFFQTDDTLILRKNFVQVLADAFRNNNIASDPIFLLSAGQVVQIPVQITRCEQRISFILNWDNPSSQIGMTVRAPDGTVFSPTSPSSNKFVVYGQQPGYCYYQIALPLLDPGSGLTIGPAQLGTWIMQIKAGNLFGTTERCITSVMVESDLQLQVVVHTTDVSAPIYAEAKILHHGSLVETAEILLMVTSPLKSLAAVSTTQVLQKASQADVQPIPAGTKALIPTKKTKYKMDFNKDKGFVLELPPPDIDGIYQFEFQASGQACAGTFERYASYSSFVTLKLHDEKR